MGYKQNWWCSYVCVGWKRLITRGRERQVGRGKEEKREEDLHKK